MVHFSVQFKESTSNFKVEFGAVTVVPKGEIYLGPYAQP